MRKIRKSAQAPNEEHRVGGSGDLESPESLAREAYERYGAELYRFAQSRLGDDGAAQDAVQETIVRAWKSAARFDPAQGSLRTWLYAILRNVVVDHHRSNQRRPVEDDDVERREGGSVMDHAETVADTDLTSRALGLISAEHRTAIVETYLRDRTYADVAVELGITVSTLRSRVYYGLRQMRFAIDSMEVEG